IDIRLAANLESAEIGDAGNLTHDVLHLVGLLFEDLEIAAKEFDGKFTLDAADGFLHVVGDGLREVPVDAGNLAESFVHGIDELLFRAELGAPFGTVQQVDKDFCVVETAGVAAVVGPADLADDLLHFGVVGEDGAGAFGDCDSGGGAGAGGQRAADPDRAFIEVREKFGADAVCISTMATRASRISGVTTNGWRWPLRNSRSERDCEIWSRRWLRVRSCFTRWAFGAGCGAALWPMPTSSETGGSMPTGRKA